MPVNIGSIARDELIGRLSRERPDNKDRNHGYALINVLTSEAFAKEHIPGSINLPIGEEDQFEQRFSKEKEIIVYCASLECDAAPTVAADLVRRGFLDVSIYEGGMSDWKRDGQGAGTRTNRA